MIVWWESRCFQQTVTGWKCLFSPKHAHETCIIIFLNSGSTQIWIKSSWIPNEWIPRKYQPLGFSKLKLFSTAILQLLFYWVVNVKASHYNISQCPTSSYQFFTFVSSIVIKFTRSFVSHVLSWCGGHKVAVKHQHWLFWLVLDVHTRCLCSGLCWIVSSFTRLPPLDFGFCAAHSWAATNPNWASVLIV